MRSSGRHPPEHAVERTGRGHVTEIAAGEDGLPDAERGRAMDSAVLSERHALRPLADGARIAAMERAMAVDRHPRTRSACPRRRGRDRGTARARPPSQGVEIVGARMQALRARRAEAWITLAPQRVGLGGEGAAGR